MSAGEAAARYAEGVRALDGGDFAAAEREFRGALALRPGHAEAHSNLGVVLQSVGRGFEAVASYRSAIEASHVLPQPYLNLGRLLQELGRRGEAEACYRQALARGLDAGVFGHLLNAASGTSSAQAPPSYVRETFDSFAARFDQHLVGTLDYRIPEILSGAVREFSLSAPIDILDLGCGTGLAGEQLRDLAGRLVGVDLAPKMLDMARARGCYQELAEAEVGAYLRALHPAGFDLVVAADVFIYIGDLAQVFGETARVLRSGGLFAFSIEQPGAPCESFRLEASGRYSQELAYVRGLAAGAGMDERCCKEVTVRTHGAQALIGQALVLQKP